ncbi:variable surface protein [Plasmodium gonderi]|uniref:Variable surface protein n=1 Tax=Plasmodium gonderi TaxID=77519 RepID=A0A1Y1JVC1_PLAGO|nr:variable surface protein [Plasmodium gonderi]GAW84333.1 variable surface protein [Plasmodium gonderi]
MLKLTISIFTHDILTYSITEYLNNYVLLFSILTVQTFSKTDLPSVKFYEMLEEDSLQLQSKKFSYCRDFPLQYDKKEQIKKLCSKYVTYLKNQKQIRRQYNQYSEYCNMLSYWVSNVLLRTLGEDQSKCTVAFGKIQLMWSFATKFDSTSYSCQPYSDIYNFYDNWENAKKLYDYYIDFNYLDNMASNCAHNCEELRRYLNEVNITYESFKESCSRNIKSVCPVININYEVYNPMLLLNKYKSHTEPQVLDMGGAQASEVETEVPPKLEEPSDAPSITIGYQQESNIKKDELNPLSAFSNTLLGLLHKKGNRLSTHRSDTYNPFREYLEENYIGYNPV